MMVYDELTVEELEAEIARLNGERAELKEEALAAHAVLDRRNIERAARRALTTLSGAERLALMQMVAAEGVESGEQVNGVV